MKKLIWKKIQEYNKIALFLHKSPDGDSISSSYGLALALKEIFPRKKIVVVGDYQYLSKNYQFLDFQPKMFTKTIDPSYLTIVGDVAIKSRIWFYEEYQKGKEKICFDHHQNKIDFDADIYWPEPAWPASSMQAVEIVWGKKTFSERTAMALLTGILTDTGFFRFSTNNPHPVELYQKLLTSTTTKGMEKFFRKMGEKTRHDLNLQGLIYKNIKYRNQVAYAVFGSKLVRKFGYNAIKKKLNSIGNIEGTHSWAFFMQTNENDNWIWKGSLRSSSKDVNQVAVKYRGGGHIRASGCYAKNMKEVREIIKRMGEI